MAEKRRSGRTRVSQPPTKKTRLSTQVKQEETPEPTPDREASPKEETKPVLLPNRIYDSRPLPTIPAPQPSTLPEDEYQSIESSRTLATALERSRHKWLNGEFFERYWTKGKKNAQATNNPSKTSMALVSSSTSTCTLIVEPMIFEARVYYIRDPTLMGAHSTTSGSTQRVPNAYGTPYRPGGGQSQQIKPEGQGQGAPRGGTASAAPNSTLQAQNKSPDPVIQLLASRASSDPALKDLMKVVATGQGTQEQLQAFQKHIDELNAIVEKQRVSEAASAASSPAPPTAPLRTLTPQQQTPFAQPGPRPIQQSAPRSRTAIPPPYPVVLEFINPGASQDRFLFPREAIIESLGSMSILASFLVIRKGDKAADPSLFDSDTEYYEPITVKIDVQAGDAEVLGYIKRSVKPADEVKAWMEEKMKTCKRADIRHLALRLPVRSQLTAAEEEAYQPPPPPVEVKKRGPYKKKADKEREAAEKSEAIALGPESSEANVGPAVGNDASPAIGSVTVESETPAEGRRRPVKRSARLIESISG